ncbi:MAG: response regulator [Nitrospirae bacterium]|nr:response regulator [Nitrospirota bacterium]
MKPYKLLLADDSLTIQKVVELVLADEHFEIKTVNDGELALDALESFDPHIVLADIEMPKLNGYQLCEKIKNNAATVHVPVVLLAGAFEPFDEEYAKAVGADDYIIKPFESQELISKVKSLMVGVEPEAAEEPVSLDVQKIMDDGVSQAEGAEPFFMEEPSPEKETASGTEDKNEPVVIADEEYEAKAAFVLPDKEFEVDLAHAMKSEEEVPAAAGSCGLIDTLELPSKDDIQEIVRQSVEKRVSDILGSEIVPALSAAIKEDAFTTLSQTAPKIIEGVTRELVAEMMQSLHGEISAAINRIVPEVAETVINKAIDKITAQP